METDRELLEWAFKAYRPGENYIRMVNDAGYDYWNPICDDGDAFRLAVKLGIQVCWHESLGYATAYYDYGSSKREEYGPDPYATTRRAIVRAAAEIGRSMK